ncbi:MAG: hypothetical protein AB1515_10040, partial [Nitrospirota bacterium]
GAGGAGIGGGGGGGHIAIYASTLNLPSISVAGGGSGAANGTLVLVQVDQLPPDPISPLQIDSDSLYPVSSTHIELKWLATGDDLNAGTAAVYDLRYRIGATFANPADYQAAFQVLGEPAPALVGTTQRMRVTGLNPDTVYCFAITAVDEAGNVSSLNLSPPDSLPPAPDVLNSTVCARTEQEDHIPPAAVVTLAAAPATNGAYTYTDQILVTWTSVGDDNPTHPDNLTGTPCYPDRTPCVATSYDLRYSIAPITDDLSFANAIPVSGVPVPQPAGGAESVIVTGLQSGQTYYFAMKVRDEVPNTSPMSNVASQALALDTTAPGNVTTLDVAIGLPIKANEIPLSFLSPGDDGAPAPCPCGTPTSYILKYSETNMTSQAEFDAAATFAGSILPLAAGQTQTVAVTGLLPGTTYYFAVEALDERGNQSGLGNVLSATTLESTDSIPPGAITDLRVVTDLVTDRTVRLEWTAKGDDGDAGGLVTAFDIRYSHKKINNNTDFDNATQVTGEPPPVPPLQGRSMTVTLEPFQHMTSNTEYYFAIKAIDDGGNRSALGTLTNSNVDPGCTSKCKVRTALRLEWNLVSVAVAPSPNASNLVFGPLDGWTNACGPGDLPCLYKWISSGLGETDGCYLLLGDPGPDLDPTDACPAPNSVPVKEGDGYFFLTSATTLLNAAGTDVPVEPASDGHHGDSDGHYHLALDPDGGWNIIGNPFKEDVQLDNVNVLRDCGGTETVNSFAAAVGAGWVGNAIYVSTTADGATSVPVGYNDPEPAKLQPWQSYWFQVLLDDCAYELVIPKP